MIIIIGLQSMFLIRQCYHNKQIPIMGAKPFSEYIWDLYNSYKWNISSLISFKLFGHKPVFLLTTRPSIMVMCVCGGLVLSIGSLKLPFALTWGHITLNPALYKLHFPASLSEYYCFCCCFLLLFFDYFSCFCFLI